MASRPKASAPDRLAVTRDRFAIPASNYSFDQLAEVYNQARVDYIVPMPMNGRRMSEYCQYYDIDLSSSFVSLNEERLETGVAMLGMRGDRSWITRLGVIPERRGHKIGQFLSEALIDESVKRQMRQVQLEVIVGNEPAHRLFLKLGFEPTRELLVIRRPPGVPTADALLSESVVSEIDEAEIPVVLATRDDGPNWLLETESLLNAGGLRGLRVSLPDGQNGWIVFQRTPFQLTRFVTGPASSIDLVRALLYHVHREYPLQDTKIENIAANAPAWAGYQAMGYMEVFRRLEMILPLCDVPDTGPR